MKDLVTTAVYLTPDECAQFLAFQKHRHLISLLDNVGAFDLKSGKVTIHFDVYGKIAGVDKQQYFRTF